MSRVSTGVDEVEVEEEGLEDGLRLSQVASTVGVDGKDEVDGGRAGGKRKDSPVELDLGERTKRRGSKEKVVPTSEEREVRRSRRLTIGRK